MDLLPVIGLEVHAELQTRSKMFCGCPVVDPTQAPPNTAVCPVCAGMPGALPVANRQAVEYAMRAALALGCRINRTSLFARKNYFYPDLPKGYQISQFEHPLAEAGRLVIAVNSGEKTVRIRRAHLEEDTGKLTHVGAGEDCRTLVDLNRAGVPLLEIVSEPDLASVEEARAYAAELRAVLTALGVNSGDMSRGAIRFEANVSLRPAGQASLGTRVEIKNLNSLRAMERAITYEIERQAALLRDGLPVAQVTLGWDDDAGVTFAQRGKEEAHDYRYFPEPDLPPVVVSTGWEEQVRAGLPELPADLRRRLQQQYGLPMPAATLLAQERGVADFFEQAAAAAERLQPGIHPADVANWIAGPLFARLNATGERLSDLRLSPGALAGLLAEVQRGVVNLPTARAVLAEMLESGRSAAEIIDSRGLMQLSDPAALAALVRQVLDAYPAELHSYFAGKRTLANWFFGQAMRKAGGQAHPGALQAELQRQLDAIERGLQS